MKSKKIAFSMTELLVTLVIFSCGMLPLIVLFSSSHTQTAQAKNLMVAHSLGRTIIAEIRSLGFDVLEDEIKTKKLEIEHSKQEVKGSLVPSDKDSIVYPDYYERFNTEVRLSKAANDKIRIELDVSWQEPSREFKLGFGSVVVKYGN